MKATIIKGKKPKANDKYAGFEDERTLAELIQNAAARGLKSTRGSFFEDDNGIDITVERNGLPLSEDHSVDPTVRRISKPPKDATCACALGAQLLSPRVKKPLESVTITVRANDAADDDDVPTYDVEVYKDRRSADIGAAYEQALRP